MIEGTQQQNKEKSFLTIAFSGQVHHDKEINFLSSKMNVVPGY